MGRRTWEEHFERLHYRNTKRKHKQDKICCAQQICGRGPWLLSAQCENLYLLEQGLVGLMSLVPGWGAHRPDTERHTCQRLRASHIAHILRFPSSRHGCRPRQVDRPAAQTYVFSLFSLTSPTAASVSKLTSNGLTASVLIVGLMFGLLHYPLTNTNSWCFCV